MTREMLVSCACRRASLPRQIGLPEGIKRTVVGSLTKVGLASVGVQDQLFVGIETLWRSSSWIWQDANSTMPP